MFTTEKKSIYYLHQKGKFTWIQTQSKTHIYTNYSINIYQFGALMVEPTNSSHKMCPKHQVT